MSAGPAPTMAELIEQLQQTLADDALSDEEKRSLAQALREAEPPEDALRQLRNRAFALARERIAAAPGSTLPLLRWLEGVARAIDNARQPAETIQALAAFSPGEQCLSLIRGQLRGARHRADLCVFTLSDDRISAEVLAMHRRGVKVRLITDGDKAHDAGSDVHALRDAGVPVALDRSAAHMHHKFALIDGSWLLNGSYNWTRSASDFNEENVVLTNHPALLAQFGAVFEKLWEALSPR